MQINVRAHKPGRRYDAKPTALKTALNEHQFVELTVSVLCIDGVDTAHTRMSENSSQTARVDEIAQQQQQQQQLRGDCLTPKSPPPQIITLCHKDLTYHF